MRRDSHRQRANPHNLHSHDCFRCHTPRRCRCRWARRIEVGLAELADAFQCTQRLRSLPGSRSFPAIREFHFCFNRSICIFTSIRHSLPLLFHSTFPASVLPMITFPSSAFAFPYARLINYLTFPSPFLSFPLFCLVVPVTNSLAK